MVLRPVKFNAAANPRTRQSYKGRLDNLIVIYKVIVSCFVVRSLHSATELGQNHIFKIIVFEKYGFVFFINLFIADFVNHRVRINLAAAALIHTLFKKQRISVRLCCLIGRNNYCFFPNFRFCVHKYHLR